MEKKTYKSIAIDSLTYKKLKLIAAKNDVSMNKALKRLIEKNGRDDLW